MFVRGGCACGTRIVTVSITVTMTERTDMRRLKMLSESQLKKLNTKRLLGVLKTARAVEQAERRRRIMDGVCCNICMVWMRGEEAWEEQVVKPTAHLTAYKNRIKTILATRENVE